MDMLAMHFQHGTTNQILARAVRPFAKARVDVIVAFVVTNIRDHDGQRVVDQPYLGFAALQIAVRLGQFGLRLGDGVHVLDVLRLLA